MEDFEEDDIKKKYPSLPPNYVSLSQLQERWLQRQQQKQQEQEQEQEQRKGKQIVLLNQQNLKQKKRVHKSQENSKSGGLRADAQAAYVPRERPGGSRAEFCGVEGVLKSDELEVRAHGVEGVDEMEKKMIMKKKKYNNRNRRKPGAKGGLIGGDSVQMASKDMGISGNTRGSHGGKEGCSGEIDKHGDTNAGIEENLSMCLVGMTLESKGKEENSVGLNGKSGGDKVSGAEFSLNRDDLEVQGSSLLKGKSGRGYSGGLESKADDQGIMEEGNVCKVEVLPENVVEEDVAVGLRRKSGVSFRGRYQKNSSNWKIGRDFKNNKVKLGESGLDMKVSKCENERNDQKGKFGIGIYGYERKERDLGSGDPKIRRDFKALSLNDSRESNAVSRTGPRSRPRRSYGNFGRSTPQKMGKLIDGGLVWMKKGETPDSEAAKFENSGGSSVCNSGAKKNEELQSHPVMEQLPNVQFCLNSPPPWPEAVFLGFQHYLLTLGTIVMIPSIIVPQMGGGNGEKAQVIQTLLFISGINTLLQSLFGTRLSSVIGGSYTFLIPVTSIIQAKRFEMFQDPRERFAQTIRAIQGALIVASCFQMIIGFVGLWRNIIRFLNPLSMVPLITLTGLGLWHLALPVLAKCVEVGIPQLIFILITSQYLPICLKFKKPICDRFALLFSVAIIWLYAGILTWSGAYHRSRDDSCRTDRSGLIGEASWIYIPFPFQWGPPTFRAGEALSMMIASFVVSAESTGSFLASARYGSATPVPPSVTSRGIGWLGFGTLLNGIFGSVTGSTATVENAGLLALTRAGSRRVIQISAAFMITFSILGKFGAIFASIPMPIIAALYCVFFGYVASAGLGFLQFCNLNSFRTKLVLGFSFFLGLSLPQYFREYQLSFGHGPIRTDSRWFNDTISVIFTSPPTIAVLIALVLDRTLPHDNDQAPKDNGSHLWEKFVLYSKDVRSDEFYKLPFQLNKFFPPL